MQIIENLRILSETKSNQIIFLENLGTFPSTDEFALDFHYAYDLFKVRLNEINFEPLVREEVLKNLDGIDLIFETMSNISNNLFWDVASLNDEEWNTVRKLASHTITLISDNDTIFLPIIKKS
jgi:hypothetical protein